MCCYIYLWTHFPLKCHSNVIIWSSYQYECEIISPVSFRAKEWIKSRWLQLIPHDWFVETELTFRAVNPLHTQRLCSFISPLHQVMIVPSIPPRKKKKSSDKQTRLILCIFTRADWLSLWEHPAVFEASCLHSHWPWPSSAGPAGRQKLRKCGPAVQVVTSQIISPGIHHRRQALWMTFTCTCYIPQAEQTATTAHLLPVSESTFAPSRWEKQL